MINERFGSKSEKILDAEIEFYKKYWDNTKYRDYFYSCGISFFHIIMKDKVFDQYFFYLELKKKLPENLIIEKEFMGVPVLIHKHTVVIKKTFF